MSDEETGTTTSLPIQALSAVRTADGRAKDGWPDGVDNTWIGSAPFEEVLLRCHEFLTAKTYEPHRTQRTCKAIEGGCRKIIQSTERLTQSLRQPVADPGEPPKGGKTAQQQQQQQQHAKALKLYNAWKDALERAYKEIGDVVDSARADLLAAGVHPLFTQAAKIFEQTSVSLATYQPLLRDLTLKSAEDTLSASFADQAASIEGRARRWQRWGLVSLGVLLLAALFVGTAAKSLGYSNVWYARFAVGAPLVAFSIYALRQAGVSDHLARQYRYREALAKVTAAFGKIIEHAPNEENRDYLKEVVLLMFSPPSFAPGKTSVEQSLKSVEGVVSSVEKIGRIASGGSRD